MFKTLIASAGICGALASNGFREFINPNYGSDIGSVEHVDVLGCSKLCENTQGCTGFTVADGLEFSQRNCQLKGRILAESPHTEGLGTITGVKGVPECVSDEQIKGFPGKPAEPVNFVSTCETTLCADGFKSYVGFSVNAPPGSDGHLIDCNILSNHFQFNHFQFYNFYTFTWGTGDDDIGEEGSCRVYPTEFDESMLVADEASTTVVRCPSVVFPCEEGYRKYAGASITDGDRYRMFFDKTEGGCSKEARTLVDFPYSYSASTALCQIFKPPFKLSLLAQEKYSDVYVPCTQ